MKAATKVRGRAKVFIIKADYAYEVSPSPVVVPKRRTTLQFENLSDVTATVSIPGARPAELKLQPNGRPESVTLPKCTEKAPDRVVLYTVEMGSGLFALGNSAPIIIRDP
jgi:hypothetical protein